MTDRFQRGYLNLLCKSSLLFLLLFFSLNMFIIPAYAEIASPDEMEQVCRNWLLQTVSERGQWNKSVAPDIIGVGQIESGDTVLATYYTISPVGFVLVPALKEMTPIKAYSDKYVLDEKQENGFILMVQEMLRSRFDIYIAQFGSLEAKQPINEEALFGHGQRDKWDIYTLSTEDFMLSRSVEKSALEEGGPLLTTSWHQRAPYSNDCPMGDGGRTVVGCVATATAQIMAYWQWPISGVGSHTYTWNGDNSCEGSTPAEELTADFTNIIDWNHIIDSCDDGCSSADSTELAALCYDVGVAHSMNYGACGSGAYTGNAAAVLSQYYKYSSEVHRDDRTGYDLAGWYGQIKEQIDKNQPTQYRIRSHSIVCDGYRSDGLQYEYHMNYGWGGSFTAWFVLDSLYCSWVEPDSVCPASEEYMVTEIHPQNTPILDCISHTIAEASGNSDGFIEGGESMDISVIIQNNGLNATNTTGTISTSDSYLTVTSSITSFDSPISWGAQSSSQTDFVIEVSAGYSDPHIAELVINLSADGGYSSVDTVLVLIGKQTGFADDIESGEGFWRHKAVTPTFSDEWHVDTYRAHSGASSWKVGGYGDAIYGDGLDAGLLTQPFNLPFNAVFTFWHWMESEFGSDTTAWDGAIVMISVDGGGWIQITPDEGYSHTIINNSASPFASGTPCFSGNNDWQQLSFDLSAYTGQAQIMFRFGSDGNTAFEGWYIDDVEIDGDAFLCGDSNADLQTNLGDAVYIINYVFKGGPAPIPVDAAEANCDGTVNIADAVYLINYIFKGGPAPCSGC
ncbi:MAG: C10 family peptidase [candidate division Zixibacteria bacterium]|nr:C10 family peptidase [candidate division Zixibacteria bacterium]